MATFILAQFGNASSFHRQLDCQLASAPSLSQSGHVDGTVDDSYDDVIDSRQRERAR
jgi:hypothetical protein